MKTFTLFAILILSGRVFSQTDTNSTTPPSQQYKTLFSMYGNEPKVSGMFAFHLDVGQYNNNLTQTTQPTLNLGGEMAVILNKVFYMGFYGRGMVTFPEKEFTVYNQDSSINKIMNTNAFFGHGGLVFGGIFMPNKPVHFALSMKIGGGGYTLFNEGFNYNNDQNENYNGTWTIAPVMVITPQADLEFNITQWFRFKLGFGYQWVSAANEIIKYQDASNNSIEKEIMNTSELCTPYFSAGFVFGWFK